jgi:S-DNA-T family DNA segregation ATPase FtsK/SpoIIIE
MAGKKKAKKPSKKEDDEKDFVPGPSLYERLGAQTVRGIAGVVLFVIAILLTLAPMGMAGVAGEKMYAGIRWVVGVGYYLLPLILTYIAFMFFKMNEKEWVQPIRLTGAVLGFVSVLTMVGVLSSPHAGHLGNLLAGPLGHYFGTLASLVILTGLVLIALLLLLDSELWLLMGQKVVALFKKRAGEVSDVDGVTSTETPETTEYGTSEDVESEYDDEEYDTTDDEDDVEDELPVKQGVFGTMPIVGKKKKVKEVFMPPSTYNPPPLSLLQPDRGTVQSGDTKVQSNLIKRTLDHFKIPVEMDEITVGPTVTRYAMKPAEGVKLSRITALQQNLEYALAASPLRIEAPIPGKSLVGVEVPNRSKAIVGLEGLLAAPAFYESKAPLLFALGKDIAGGMHYSDISELPHLLIAGATKSGKSVMVHSLITSLLYRNGPEALRLILVDPKQVELTLYENIPHLLTPVIIEPKRSIAALAWAGKEMERRYTVLKESGVRDVHEYHEAVSTPWMEKHQNELDNEEVLATAPERMPRIVIIIDELADIMQAYPRELEGAIVKLAQKSRAVGIHLVLSTQSPRAEIVTGLIKANMPARIALKVSTIVESRIVLDDQGADKLLGNGDMLYKAADMPKPRRIQSPFLTSTEVKAVVKYLIEHNEPSHEPPIVLPTSTSGGSDGGRSGEDGGEDRDELYEEIKEVVITSNRASTSLIQRKFKVGYGRAARIMDMLEEDGIIAPSEGGNRPREVIGGGGEIRGAHDGLDDVGESDGRLG